MRRFLLVCALAGSGLVWALAALVVCPLARVMRADLRARREADDVRASIGYDDNNVGIDIETECDECGRCPIACAQGVTGCVKVRL